MIVRIIYFLIPLILLPDAIVYAAFCHKRTHAKPWLRLLWWLPSTAMVVFSIVLALQKQFAPDNSCWIKLFIFAFALCVIPKMMFAIAVLITRRWGKQSLKFRRSIYAIATLMSVLILCTTLHGVLVGPKELRVTRLSLTFKTLPKAFDGLKIVLFSDAHVGTFNHGWERFLARDIDTILAQRPDMICFVGDLQNTNPAELQPLIPLLARLAKQGIPVYSVLGNHDYSGYYYGTAAEKQKIEAQMIATQKEMGWQLLRNEHRFFYSSHHKDSIAIVGEEYCGVGLHSFDKSNIRRATAGIDANTFTLLLQHDPKTWRTRILPESHAQLTLAGHTHGGQVSIFGLRTTLLTYTDDYGLAESHGRYLYVTCGIGGLIPLRIGVEPEIAVITLHAQQ